MARRQSKPPPDDILPSQTAADIAGLERVYFPQLIREDKGPIPQRAAA